ncbi:Ribosomal_RNA processing protein 36 [Hexamita inflata]|uniref:rRNA biogenesis protein RRP36 n=1 Tax=Hexamita inflata TaxID=28002 RepID=A0AA86PTV7_9EUKA|nr:Ribosomal RNA processing protein 36 [Hexamita inflata]CAI9940864.1 Ribosomal RNA processing protein 36 [Hexamita inflata]
MKDEPFSAPTTKPVSAADVNQTFPRSERKRDPRFDQTQEFDSKAFHNSYKFVKEIREKEVTELQKELKTIDDRSSVKAKRVMDKINTNRQKIGNVKSFEKAKEIKQKLKMKENEAVKDGKQKFHMSEKRIEEVVKAARFHDKQNGSMKRKFIEKKYEEMDKKFMRR